MSKKITEEYLENVSGGIDSEIKDIKEYLVKIGDTIESVAIRNHTTPEIIKSLNKLTDIKPGQTIKLPDK